MKNLEEEGEKGIYIYIYIYIYIQEKIKIGRKQMVGRRKADK